MSVLNTQSKLDLKSDEVYKWKSHLTIVRHIDCLYLWSSSVAMELSLASNGWFRYLLNNKLFTMYSSGTPEVSLEKNGW